MKIVSLDDNLIDLQPLGFDAGTSSHVAVVKA